MANNTALVSWNAITLNSDLTPCTDLASYKVYYSQIPNTWSAFVSVIPPLVSKSLDLTQLNNDGTWYFAVSGVDTTGNEGVKTLTSPTNKRIIRTGSKIRRVH